MRTLSEIDKKWLKEAVFGWPDSDRVGNQVGGMLFEIFRKAYEDGNIAQAQSDNSHYVDQSLNSWIPTNWWAWTQSRQSALHDWLYEGGDHVFERITLIQSPYDPTYVTETYERPVPIPDDVRRDYDQFMAEMVAIDKDNFAASRAVELEEAHQKILSGEIDSAQAPEIAAQAMRAKREAKAKIEEKDQEEARLVSEIEAIEGRIVAAKAIIGDDSPLPPRPDYEKSRDVDQVNTPVVAQSSPETIDGWKKSLKRITRQISHGFKEVTDPVRKLRDTISHNLLPKEARRIGRKFEKEVKRFGYRVDDNFQRSVKWTASNAGFMKWGAALLNLIPGVGTLLYLLVTAGIASAEVTYAYKVKRETDHAIRMMKRELQAHIEMLLNEARRLEAKAADVEKQREALEKLADIERSTRIARQTGFEAGRAKRRGVLIASSAIILGTTSYFASKSSQSGKNKAMIIGTAALASVLGFSIYSAQKANAQLQSAITTGEK